MSFLSNFLGKRKPAREPPPKRGTGSAGVIPSDEVEAFLDHGAPLLVSSSKVGMAQYFPADQKLMVEYLDGKAWLYDPISRAKAEAFARAPSKGTWVWDNIK